MRFEFCGNMDCPEWVLSEVVLLNKISAIKLRIMLAQIVKKVVGQQFEQDKLVKLCKEQKMNAEDTKVFLAVIEFIIFQAGKHIVSEQSLSKDLLQMGIAIEIANAIVKVYNDNLDSIQKALKSQSLKVSQIQGMQYKLSYLFASSQSGQDQDGQTGGQVPLDLAVTLRLELNEFPTSDSQTAKAVKFGMTKNKFLQFSKDMNEALGLLEATTTLE